MKRLIVKICLKLLAWFYPKIDELLLEKFILIMFPGNNFSSLVAGDYMDKQIVFKAIKNQFRELENYYIIAVYYHEANKVVIQAIKKEQVDSNEIAKKAFYDVYNNL